MKPVFVATLLSVVGLGACDDSFTKGWLVDRTRVLGVRFEGQAGTSAAASVPGETTRATWVIASPRGAPRLAWAYALCTPPAGVFPEPRCNTPLLASGAGSADDALVAMDIAVPPETGEARELLVLAAFCETGPAELDATKLDGRCGGGGAPLLASATLRLVSSGANRNPVVAEDDVTFDGAALVGSPLRAGAACSSGEAVVVAPGSKHEFALRFRGDEREPEASLEGGVETLIASHVVTGGELERQFSWLEPREAAPKSVGMEWTAPSVAAVSKEGLGVEAVFVVRDGRGGLGFLRRAVCVRTP